MTDAHLTTRDIAIRCVRMMSVGSLADFETFIHPDAVNRQSRAEPAAARGRGPHAFHASALWLRAAYSDMEWTINEAVTEGDLVVLHTTMSGRQVGPFVNYGDVGQVTQVMPPNGRPFAVTQSHWFRTMDGLIMEHWANRDDIGMAQQLGWVPPTPRYLVRMALAKRRAQRPAG